MKISFKNTQNIRFNNRFTSFASKKNDFNPYYHGSKVPHGANYGVVDSFECSDKRTIFQLRDDNANGIDISDGRDIIIFRRIKKAEHDAKEFIKYHPQFEYDDIVQSLIEFVVIYTDRELSPQCSNYIFNTRYAESKDSYFEKLIEKENQKPDFIAFSEIVEVSHGQEINNELPDYLKNALEFLLTPKQKFILYKKYGININRCMSADDIAEELGTTVRNVHKQERLALRKLRRYLSFLYRNS